MRPCISQATTMPSTFAEDVANYADAGCDAMEVWLTKLENHLETCSLDDTRRLLDERRMTLAAAAYQGGLLLSQGDARRAHFEHYRKRLDLCQQLGIRTLLIAADFTDKTDAAALGRAVVSLKEAAQWASAYDVTLALEFRGKSSFCASLDTAVALVHECAEPNVGINLDLFHYYTVRASLRTLRTSPRRGLRTFRSATCPASRGSWRPTATASFPGMATSSSCRSSMRCARSVTRAGCRWS
jgi:2-keto-myo-inositol isomerase